MVHIRQVDKCRSEGLADGLLSETYSQYTLGRRVAADKWQKDACLLRDAGAGRQEDLVETVYFVQCYFIVAMYFYICSQFL